MDISYARDQEKLLLLIPILHTEYLHDSDTQKAFIILGWLRYLICLCLVIDLYTTTFLLCSFDAFSA